MGKAGRRPCGFCTTGDCQLCRGSYSNGAAAPDGPVWGCPCAASGHPRRRDTGRQAGPVVTVQLPGQLPPEPRPEPVPAPAVTAQRTCHCVLCGYDFGHPQTRKTCRSAAACERRRQALDSALRGAA
jgi:hypothetical protein